MTLRDCCSISVKAIASRRQAAALSVLRKLGLRDRIQVVIRAYDSCLVEPGDL